MVLLPMRPTPSRRPSREVRQTRRSEDHASGHSDRRRTFPAFCFGARLRFRNLLVRQSATASDTVPQGRPLCVPWSARAHTQALSGRSKRRVAFDRNRHAPMAGAGAIVAGSCFIPDIDLHLGTDTHFSGVAHLACPIVVHMYASSGEPLTPATRHRRGRCLE